MTPLSRRRRTLFILIVVLAGTILVAVPTIHLPPSIPGPGPGGSLALPDRYESVTRYFSGFGGEATYGFQHYYFHFCTSFSTLGYTLNTANWELDQSC